MHRMPQACLALSLLLSASTTLAGDGGGGGGGLDLTIHYGLDKYDSVGLRSGLGGVKNESLLKDTSTTVGATAIFRSGMLELGGIGEIGRPGQSGSTTLLGALGGLGFDLGRFRLEALGELGGHKYGDVLHDAAVVSRSRSDAWLVSVGLRPGLAMRLGPQDALLVGVWAFARWDVTSQDVQVNLGGGNSSTYKLGGSQFGASLRVGISL
jgi:hypothetical protein